MKNIKIGGLFDASVAGTMNPEHLNEIYKSADVTLTRSEWYEIYRAAGHMLP